MKDFILILLIVAGGGLFAFNSGFFDGVDVENILPVNDCLSSQSTDKCLEYVTGGWANMDQCSSYIRDFTADEYCECQGLKEDPSDTELCNYGTCYYVLCEK